MGGDDLTRRARSTHWMHLIQSSFSSSVEADILYTVCFPSTTWAKIGVNICDVILLFESELTKYYPILRGVLGEYLSQVIS